MTQRPFPSIEQVLVVWLKDQLGVHVTAELPARFETTLPIITVDRISGADLDFKIDRPVIDIDCYAATRSLAQDLAELVRATLRFELVGSVIPDVVVTRVRTVVGPRWLPHANPAVRRYSANYELCLHTRP